MDTAEALARAPRNRICSWEEGSAISSQPPYAAEFFDHSSASRSYPAENKRLTDVPKEPHPNGFRVPGGSEAAIQNGFRVPGGSQATIQNGFRVPGGSQATIQNGFRVPGGSQATIQNGFRVPGGSEAAGCLIGDMRPSVHSALLQSIGRRSTRPVARGSTSRSTISRRGRRLAGGVSSDDRQAPLGNRGRSQRTSKRVAPQEGWRHSMTLLELPIAEPAAAWSGASRWQGLAPDAVGRRSAALCLNHLRAVVVPLFDRRKAFVITMSPPEQQHGARRNDECVETSTAPFDGERFGATGNGEQELPGRCGSSLSLARWC